MKKTKPSLASQLYLVLALLSLGAAGIFIMTYTYAVAALREQVFLTNQTTLSMYSDLLTVSFQNAERFLSGFAFNDSDLALMQDEDPLTRNLATYREQEKMADAIPSHSGIDGFFIYAPRYQIYCASAQSSVGSGEQNALRDRLTTALRGGALQPDGSGAWQAYRVEDSYYLMRIIIHSGIYVGAWVNVENLLDPLRESALQQDGGVFLYTRYGTPLSGEVAGLDGYDPSQAPGRYQLVGSGKRYLALSWQTEERYYLVSFISDASIRAGMRGIYRMVLLTLVLVAVIFLLLYAALRKMFLRPMRQLSAGIKRLRDGELGVTLQEEAKVREFEAVNASFNDMSARIRQLTISVYEQKLKRQQIFLEYLKQQITPHFYINCLNTIYSLAGLGKNDLVRKLAKELSQHLRYTMNSRDTVRLGRELGHVENYIAMTALRYPDTLRFSADVQPGAEAALVPPLILQSFVENTVKYEVVMGEPIELHIQVVKYRREGKWRLYICIWDTGGGYSADALRMIQKEADAPADDTTLGDGTKIGIANTIQRLRVLFGEDMRVRYSNRPGAGAQCEFFIPFRVEEEENAGADRR